VGYPALSDAVLPARLAIITTSMELRDRPAVEVLDGTVVYSGQPMKVRVQDNLRGIGGADVELYYEGNLVASGRGVLVSPWGHRALSLAFTGEDYERIHNLIPCQKIVFSFENPCATAVELYPVSREVRAPATIVLDLVELVGYKNPFYAEIRIWAGYCRECATVDLVWPWYRYRVARIEAETFEAEFASQFIGLVGPVERIEIRLLERAVLRTSTRICYWRVPVEAGTGELYLKWWRYDGQGNIHFIETWRVPVTLWHACLDDPAKVPFSVVGSVANVGLIAYESLVVPRVAVGCLSSQ